MSIWATLGDTAHAVSVINVMVFAYMVGFHRDFFDPLWKEQGFCVMNPDNEYWTSHDLCLYTDFALSGVLLGIVTLLKDQPGMEAAVQLAGVSQILGIIGHGIGHGAIAKSRRGVDNNAEENIQMNQSPWEAGEFVAGVCSPVGLIFWILLLKATLPKQSWPSLAALSLTVRIVAQFFPRNFMFTFVQSVLFVAFAWNELMMKPKEDKGFEYALYPWLVGFPVGLIGWLESTQCSGFVIRLGGHLIYDAYIPLSTALFYMICWIRASIAATNKSAPSKAKVA
ncbi:expressed unknown protein [Seminavis robusta]|uniref:Uncharacterized protein n=1 Tax=Seminavis robusta TaxID=568900 RepID=A0A9N8H8A8_9STRA|nr:expressed unknown protein [Seminavis robusta]|eukprot:Sro211_g087820.1 n/a (282) ;mRNA; r:6568-7413